MFLPDSHKDGELLDALVVYVGSQLGPSTLVRLNIPRVRALSLHKHRIEFVSPVMPKLYKLTIGETASFDKPLTAEMFPVLRFLQAPRMPSGAGWKRLERLDLEWLTDADAEAIIQLPALKELDVNCEFSQELAELAWRTNIKIEYIRNKGEIHRIRQRRMALHVFRIRGIPRELVHKTMKFI